MKTFLDLVRANGYSSIQDFLEAVPTFEVGDDLSEDRLEKIRRSEAMTDHYLGGTAC